MQWRTRRGDGGGGRPPAWKINGKLCFQGKRKVLQKSGKTKNISTQWKILGQTMFFRESACCSKFRMIKNIYSIQWIQGTLCFSGQAQVAQKTWKIKTISTQWKVSGQLCFSGQESCSKIWKYKISDGPSGKARKGVPPLPQSWNVQNELGIQNNKLNKNLSFHFEKVQLLYDSNHFHS